MDRKRLDEIKSLKDGGKKDKDFKNLSAKEKDALLETVCKMLGLIK